MAELEILSIDVAGCALRLWVKCPYCGRPGFILASLKRNRNIYDRQKVLHVLHDNGDSCVRYGRGWVERGKRLKEEADRLVERYITS